MILTISFDRYEQSGQRVMENEFDIEVSDDLSAQDFIHALHTVLDSQTFAEDGKKKTLFCTRPLVLLHGDRPLKDFGVHDGTVIHFRGNE